MRAVERAVGRGLHRWVAPRKALVSFFADYGPKGCRGERREAGIQWIQPPKAVSDPEFRQTTSGTHGSANRADCLPQGKPPACINKRQLCRKKFPLVGIDAPTPAREKGLQPYGALDCFEWRSEGGAGGRAESPQCARRRNPLPPAGSDAPTPARIGTGRPKGRSHFSFGGERKVCKRKPAARRLQRRPAPLRVAGFVLR